MDIDLKRLFLYTQALVDNDNANAMRNGGIYADPDQHRENVAALDLLRPYVMGELLLMMPLLDLNETNDVAFRAKAESFVKALILLDDPDAGDGSPRRSDYVN